MTADIKRQISLLSDANPKGKGKTPPTGGKASSGQQSDAQRKAEAAARREVVGFGRLAWENTTFGIPLYCRKFTVLTEDQAQQLDRLFQSFIHNS